MQNAQFHQLTKMDIAQSSHNFIRPTRGLGYFANLQELVYEARRELFAGYIPSVNGAPVVPFVVPPDENQSYKE